MGFCDFRKLRKSDITSCVNETEGSSEKILNYVKCTYGRIFVPSQNLFFIICACTIFPTLKLIVLERYELE